MLRRSVTILSVASLMVVLLCADTAATPEADAGGAAAWVRLPGQVLPALAKATVVASPDRQAEQPLTLTIVLRRRDQAGFERYLREVYNSHSAQFHHFLSPSQLAERFGPSPQAYAGVLNYLRANGLKLVEGSANRLTLTMRATKAAAARTFAVRIRSYRSGTRQFYANAEDPLLPAEIAPAVQAIIGLSNLAQPARVVERNPFFVNILCQLAVLACPEASASRQQNIYQECTTDLKPCNSDAACFASLAKALALQCTASGSSAAGKSAASGIRPPWIDVDGTGQTIGLLEFDKYNPADLTDYLAFMGLPSTLMSHLSEVPVNGGAKVGSGEDEVLLDINAALTVAPGAQTVVYDAPFAGAGASFQTLFNRMINDHVTVISNSWAYCEDQTTLADVSSIDSILAAAAASGISVFNGAGDTGSTCLDGSANTVAVPADSPNATAVGGSSLSSGPASVYQSESWWNGAGANPPSGQGGFGLSKFFSRPAYQSALNSTASRSVPDVVTSADPASGVLLCQADAGGCPTGLLYGGTSNAAPIWAGYAALLNQAQGANLGFLNPLLYPLAKSSGFHPPASMGSDFAHVGLGSPNVNVLHLLLSGQSAGVPSSTASLILPSAPIPAGSIPIGVAADGTTSSPVLVALIDANGNSVSGKAVTLSAGAGSHAKISPPSAVTNIANGVATFQVTDLTAEKLTLTAKDTTDGIVLSQSPTLSFVTAPAVSAGLDAFPASVAADGISNAVIVVTLKDKLGRPSPGKLVQISQGPGNSVIKGPIPALTDASGQVQFTAVDQVAQAITYSVVDVTDGNLPFPTTASVSFTGGPANGCGNGTPPAAPGFQVTPYATGFIAQSFFFGDVNFTCSGAYGMAFDLAGDLYVTDSPTGNIYKFPPGGGIANSSTLITATALGPSLAGLVFDHKGRLFASRDATTGNFTTGAVFEIDPSNGTIVNTVAANLTCPTALAVDPLSGDLFTDDSCSGAGSDNPAMWRISGQDTSTPKTMVYANMPGTPNANISFAASGTIYAWGLNGPFAHINRVSATNGPSTPTVSTLANLAVAYLGLVASGTQANGDAQSLFLNPFDTTTKTTSGIAIEDLTSSPPSPALTLVPGPAGANNLVRGPDGCIYAAQGDAVFKITDATGSCTYAAPAQPPALELSPPTFSPNPIQGTPQTLAATFHYTAASLGTPIFFTVTGANPQSKMVRSGVGGSAAFSYVGIFPGVDTVTANAALGTINLTSNQSVITWAVGKHTSFLTLNLSPAGAMAGKAVTLTAALSDISVSPAVPVSGVSVQLSLQGNSCVGTTDAKGIASCKLTPATPEVTAQTAKFAGNSTLLAATATAQFSVTGPPTVIPTFTPAKTPTPTPLPTPGKCANSTPLPTVLVPTPTPLPGHPVITSVSNPVPVGDSFVIKGSNFTQGSVVNFFVGTAAGATNAGPLKPTTAGTATQLVVPVPPTTPQGQGFVSLQVINTDQGYTTSNLAYALLQGSAAAGLPSIAGVNGQALAATSLDPSFATANVETTLMQGSVVTINGGGFDTKNGVAVDVFTADGKLTDFLNPGDLNLGASSILFTLPPGAPTGPGSIVVSNAGTGHSYTTKSDAVSVPIGAQIMVDGVTQSGSTFTVDGAGFSALTVINLFNAQSGKVVNLGGLGAGGKAKIALTLINSTRFTFTKPAGAVPGAAFVQALNPPFVPFTSSGNDPCAAFVLK